MKVREKKRKEKERKKKEKERGKETKEQKKEKGYIKRKCIMLTHTLVRTPIAITSAPSGSRKGFPYEFETTCRQNTKCYIFSVFSHHTMTPKVLM